MSESESDANGCSGPADGVGPCTLSICINKPTRNTQVAPWGEWDVVDVGPYRWFSNPKKSGASQIALLALIEAYNLFLGSLDPAIQPEAPRDHRLERSDLRYPPP